MNVIMGLMGVTKYLIKHHGTTEFSMEVNSIVIIKHNVCLRGLHTLNLFIDLHYTENKVVILSWLKKLLH